MVNNVLVYKYIITTNLKYMRQNKCITYFHWVYVQHCMFEITNEYDKSATCEKNFKKKYQTETDTSVRVPP